MEYVVLIVLVAGFALVYFKKTEVKTESSQELLLQLNDALRKEIQEIRKDFCKDYCINIIGHAQTY